jgi:predicted nucleotide-binding protein
MEGPMARKRKTYSNTKFSPEVIQAAFDVYARVAPGDRRTWASMTRRVGVTRDEQWDLDTDDEFFARYRGPIHSAEYGVEDISVGFQDLLCEGVETRVSVKSAKVSDIEAVFNIFEDRAEQSRVPRPIVRPRVFIGHGRNDQWRDLRDDLRDLHGLDAFSFETEMHAGQSITEVLEEMASAAGFALLVHTGEDETADSGLRARQNVIHETGLFQGTLGAARALVIREEQCEAFSNIGGIQELRFERGHIREVTGQVLAAIEREFPGR